MGLCQSLCNKADDSPYTDLLRQGRQEVPEELLPVPDDDLQQQDRQVEPEEIAVAPENDELYNGFKKDLITHYRENESEIPAAPLVDEHKVPIEDLYVVPPIWAYDKPNYLGPSKSTNIEKTSARDDAEGREVSVSQIFYNEGNSIKYRKIYLTANAGFGKTSLSQKLTMTWCQSHSPLESLTEKYEEADINAMKYFDLLFLLHLRDYQSDSICNLDDMIMKLLSSYMSQKLLYTNEFLQRMLHDKKCLIIVDGLDEWSHPEHCTRKPEVPHNNHPDSCTVLTTTRDWKLGTVGLSSQHIDRRVEISQLDDKTRKQLETNAIRILNKNELNLAGKDISDFDEEVASLKSEVILYIPYILLQLICLFFGDLPIGKSKCEIYSNITEFTLERGLNKKNLPDILLSSNDNTAVPNCLLLRRNERCNCYSSLIMKLGKLAFFTLFGERKESSVIFDSKIVTRYMTAQEIDFCLKVGLLCQSKDSSVIAVKRYKVFLSAQVSARIFCRVLHNKGNQRRYCPGY